jgi:phage N-6-adenine-methyltransferase
MMMNDKVMFSSKSDVWETPQDFFDKLNSEFKFKTDVCATEDNAKCENYYTPEQDGLKQEWQGNCWMNPPYGREIGTWMGKAYNSARKNGATVVCLVPARTDTKWWHTYGVRGKITYLKGRLKFGDGKNAAPFPSAVIVFRPTVESALQSDYATDN